MKDETEAIRRERLAAGGSPVGDGLFHRLAGRRS